MRLLAIQVWPMQISVGCDYAVCYSWVGRMRSSDSHASHLIRMRATVFVFELRDWQLLGWLVCEPPWLIYEPPGLMGNITVILRPGGVVIDGFALIVGKPPRASAPSEHLVQVSF